MKKIFLDAEVKLIRLSAVDNILTSGTDDVGYQSGGSTDSGYGFD